MNTETKPRTPKCAASWKPAPSSQEQAGDTVTGFLLHLRAAGRTPRTAQTYGQALDLLAAFTQAMGMPRPEALSTEHIRHFLASLRERGNSPATVRNRYASLRAYYSWLAEEGEITVSPMARIKPPKLAVQVMPSYSLEDVGTVLTAIRGNEVLALRDRAIVTMLIDTGLRSAELCELRVEECDLKSLTLHVHGKGGKERLVPIGLRAAKEVERYGRKRGEPSEWLFASANRGRPLNYNALRLMLGRRFRAAGVGYHGAHCFRRAFAEQYLEQGGSPLDLQSICGWQSDSMVLKYVAGSQSQRALRAARQFSPGDRLP